MPLLRAIPLFLNSSIFAAIGYGNSGNFAATEEEVAVLSISDSCSWNLVPCALLRSGVCSTSDVACGLVVVWHFQMIYSGFIVVRELCIHIETLRFLPTTFTETYVYAARPSDTIISIVTAYLRCDKN